METKKIVYEIISSRNTKEFANFHDALRYFHDLKKLGLGVSFNARREQDKATDSVFMFSSAEKLPS